MRLPYVKPTAIQIKSWLKANAPNHHVRHSKSRGEIYLIDNPTIPGDSGHHVGISPEQGWVRDFRPQYSDYSTSFLRFVAKVRNFSIQDAINEVCGKDANLKALLAEARLRQTQKDEAPEEEVVDERITLPTGLLPITDRSLKRAWEFVTGYLAKRTVTIEEAEKYKLYYNATMLCFPYIEYGELVYWQARQIVNKQFLFPPNSGGKSAGDFLHGFDNAEPCTQVILAESIFNEIVLGEGAMATGGAILKKNQYKKLKVLRPSKIILAPDNDPRTKSASNEMASKPGAGLASLRDNFYMLRRTFGDILYYALPPKEFKDWNDMAQARDRLNNLNIVRDWVENNHKKLTESALQGLLIPD